MTREIHVEIQSPSMRSDDEVRLGCTVRGHPRWRKRNGSINFIVPVELSPFLAVRGRPDDIHDAFARATLWPAMEAGHDLVIHGRLSERLLANLERYQEIVCRWWPEYRPVRIHADEEVGDASSNSGDQRGAILAFSGGLDSVESLAAHAGGRRGRNTLDIQAGLFVHGFDIAPSDARFALALERARRITDRFDIPLWTIRTNLKRMLPQWETTFSTAAAAALSLFERRFSSGVIGASEPYEDLHWIDSRIGSTPLSDPLLSSERFHIVHDGALSRIEKTAALAACDFVWKDLRVCWQGDDPSRNCGRCEKCKRQMLCMAACGVDDFSGFDERLAPAKIAATERPSSVVIDQWKCILAHAVRQGLGEHENFRAMRELLDRFDDESASHRTDAAESKLRRRPWSTSRIARHLLQAILPR